MVETSSIIDYFYQKGYINDKKSNNYIELFHNLVIQLINNQKYEELIILCYDVYSFKENLPLIQKLIFTLINLHANKGAVDLCELCLKNSQEDEIFYEAINDFLKYDNYSGIIDLCRMYIRIKPNGNLSFIRTVILGFLKKGIKYFKIYNLIGELLEMNRGVKYIYTIIYSMLEIQNYEAVINISKLILQSNSKEKLNLLSIINLLIDNGKCKEAWELCKILLRLYPSSIDVLILYGKMLVEKGKQEQAQDIFKSILKQLPSTTSKLKSKILNYVGWTYFQQGDLKKATNPCIKSMKLNPTFPDSYNNLGLIYFKKGYFEKAIKLIKRALNLKTNFCQAWVNLANINFEMANYYEAFTACYTCLSLNNQHQKAIDLYKKLSENSDVKILSYLIPRMIHLGYRSGFDSLNEIVFPNRLLKNYRYITYSQEFLTFLKRIRLAQLYLNDFVSIYCWLPKCNNCESLLRLYGERINYKDGSRTKMYRCEKCGTEKKKIEQIDNQDIPYLKVRVILESSSLHNDRKTLFYSKLDYERIFITYSTLDAINSKSNSSELIDSLEKAVLLYGQDIKKKLS